MFNVKSERAEIAYGFEPRDDMRRLAASFGASGVTVFVRLPHERVTGARRTSRHFLRSN
jgi:hypothetical protein